VESSSKHGYYIQANVGRGAPVTLQVSKLAEQIFKDNDYGDADTVPTKLVWAMYDVGLLSTGGSTQTSGKTADVYSAFTSTGVSSRLRDSTRRQLTSYLDDYHGRQQRQVNRLQQKISISRRESNSTQTANNDTPTTQQEGGAKGLFELFRTALQWVFWKLSLQPTGDSSGAGQGENGSSERISQKEADGMVVELTIESEGGTRESLTSYKNHIVHVDGGTPGETLQVRLEAGRGFLIGHIISSSG
jgi:hypothetical protein